MKLNRRESWMFSLKLYFSLLILGGVVLAVIWVARYLIDTRGWSEIAVTMAVLPVLLALGIAYSMVMMSVTWRFVYKDDE